jgi:hypothetical protein
MPPVHPSNSSALLAMPLEIRRQIYRLCIPQKLCFNCSGDLSFQNRPNRWFDPLLPSEEQIWDDEQDPNETLRPTEENDRPDSDWESSVGDPLDLEDDDEEDEYEPSRLDDYCQESHRYHPKLYRPRRSALPALLLVCRQITDEVKEMLYGGNTFTVNGYGDGQRNFEQIFLPETRVKMRKMILVFRAEGVIAGTNVRTDQKTWDCILSNLSILGIIAQQPEPAGLYESLPSEPEGAFEIWAAWLTPILEYLGQTLPDAAEVLVDANKEEGAVQICENVLPGRCRFQRLRAADYIFSRGECSLEPYDWYDDGPTSCRDIINDSDYDYYYSD